MQLSVSCSFSCLARDYEQWDLQIYDYNTRTHKYIYSPRKLLLVVQAVTRLRVLYPLSVRRRAFLFCFVLFFINDRHEEGGEKI